MLANAISDEDLKKELFKKRESHLIENQVLNQMLIGFPVIQIDSHNLFFLQALNLECNLEKYLTLTIPAEELSTFNINAKLFLSFILCLNSLELRGLVERKIGCISALSPEDGIINLEGKLKYTDAIDPRWQSRALDTKNTNNRNFNITQYAASDPNDLTHCFELYFLSYTLTEKGYDIAIKFLEHSDQKERFEIQTSISRSSANSAKSSKRIALAAVIVASILAASSLANLFFNYLTTDMKSNKIEAVSEFFSRLLS